MYHRIFLWELLHCGIKGVANDCFSSHLSNRQQYVSINAINSEVKPRLHDVSLTIYMNDLNRSIRFSTTGRFVDDTNLLYIIDREETGIQCKNSIASSQLNLTKCSLYDHYSNYL